jgi:hypothetical protein
MIRKVAAADISGARDQPALQDFSVAAGGTWIRTRVDGVRVLSVINKINGLSVKQLYSDPSNINDLAKKCKDRVAKLVGKR